MTNAKFPAEIDQNFFHLINYIESEIEDIEREQAIKYIDQLIRDDEYSNLGTYDLINYELLIFIECKFSQDQEIQQMLQVLKKKICDNYIYKDKLIKRFYLKRNSF